MEGAQPKQQFAASLPSQPQSWRRRTKQTEPATFASFMGGANIKHEHKMMEGAENPATKGLWRPWEWNSTFCPQSLCAQLPRSALDLLSQTDFKHPLSHWRNSLPLRNMSVHKALSTIFSFSTTYGSKSAKRKVGVVVVGGGGGRGSC